MYSMIHDVNKCKFFRYQKAVDAKKDRASKSSQSFGAKGQRGGHPSQVGSFTNVTI